MKRKLLTALSKMESAFKADDKARKSPGDTLQRIIDVYCESGEFNKYLELHGHTAGKYLPRPGAQVRPTRFRASSAGDCVQQQAFKAIVEEAFFDAGVMQWERVTIVRPAQQQRALYNGTFSHIRWHMMFDALHDLNLVETLGAEVQHVNFQYNISGTIDRWIRFPFEGRLLSAILDFKTMKSRYWTDIVKPETSHAMQQHDYKLLDFNADVFMMLYENKDTQQLKITTTQYSDLTLRKLRSNYVAMGKWITEVMDGVPQTERTKLPLITTWCRSCPFLPACDKENPERVKLVEVEPSEF